MIDNLGRFTILNVNDSEASRYLTSKVLRNAGFNVTEAATGAEALEAARSRPHLVVLDVNLPDIDGLEVCRRLKADPLTAGIAVLHTSATYVTPGKRIAGLDSGGDGYLVQPFEALELLATVRSLLRMRLAEQAAREHAERLQELDRRKDEFLAMLGHELRNPLSAINTALPLLERLELPSHQARFACDVMRRQSRNLGRLVDDLLDVSRVTRGKIELRREALDLGRLLRQVVSTALPMAESRQQHLHADIPEEPILVVGDATRLEQVIANLLDNATKYADPGGRVLVTAHHERLLGWVEVSVKDAGIGIAPEALPRVFELFSQVDTSFARVRGGMGIGLTVVKALVEMHGGSVEARSAGLGKGSEFVLRLPLGDAVPLGARHEPGPALLATQQAARRVVLIEDNADSREVMKALFQEWGHEVWAAANGVYGVQLVLTHTPDLALVDIGLPDLDGNEVARRIRSTPGGRMVRLVALTGYGSPSQRGEALRAGFDQVLVKPASVEQILALLESVRAEPPQETA